MMMEHFASEAANLWLIFSAIVGVAYVWVICKSGKKKTRKND